MVKKSVNFAANILTEDQIPEASQTITLSSQSQEPVSSQSQEPVTSPSQPPLSTDLPSSTARVRVVAKSSKNSKIKKINSAKRRVRKSLKNGFMLGVIGTNLGLEANYRCRDTKEYTVYQILDRWFSDTADSVTHEHLHIGYIVLFENFLTEPWAVKFQDMVNCDKLIRAFEKQNPISEARPNVFQPRVAVYSAHCKDFKKSNESNRTGAKIGDRGEVTECERGELYEYIEGYGEDACSIIALNIHFRKRLFESMEDFRASFTSDYKKKVFFIKYLYGILS